MTRLPCPPELWPAFSALLDEALDLPEAQRRAWLAGLADEHAAVRPWLDKVLNQPSTAPDSRFLDAPTVSEPPLPDFVAGQQVGPYLLEALLGRGGMGEVWLAIRADRTPNRKVALKLPYAYLLAGVQRKRFERERDILAGLSHPNIAQLYDAGVADDRHPYLSMEWVDGLTIGHYCREHCLGIAERLVLFRQVFDAVGYAHAQLIAHRDLKPSNILVTRDGHVKLLDFGIAKLLAADRSGEATELTQAGGRAATPDYAAPEQLSGGTITTAVDIYALGVVLYELLTGARPRPVDRSTGAHMRLASTQAGAIHAESVGGLDARRLRRALNGDLDAILAKALEINPGRRYRSVIEFAADIERSRENRPISARHIGPLTLTIKFVQRHTLGVGLGGALAAALLIGSAGVTWQSIRAQHEAERATRIKDFLVDMFRASDPEIASDQPRGEITARELLDQNAGRIEKQFADDPQTAIDLLGVTAEIFYNLGEMDRYQALRHRYTELALREYGPLDTHYLSGELDDIGAEVDRGDIDIARRKLAEIDRELTKAGLDHSILRAQWWWWRGHLLGRESGQRSEQREALDKAIALFEQFPSTQNLLAALTERGYLSNSQLHYANASADFRHAIDLSRSIPQLRPDAIVQQAYNGLALARTYLGDVDGALEAYDRASQLALKTFGADNWRYWTAVANHARLLHQRGEREAADRMFEQIIAKIPEDAASSPDINLSVGAMIARTQYARSLIDEGRGEDAASLLRADVQSGAQHGRTQRDLNRIELALGDAYLAADDFEDARKTLTEAIHNMSLDGDAASSELLYAHERLGRALLGLNQTQAAKREFDAVLDDQQQSTSLSTARALGGLAELSLQEHQPDQALQQSRKASEVLSRATGIYSIHVGATLLRIQAEALLTLGDRQTALQLASSAETALARYCAPQSADLAAARRTLAAARSAHTSR